MESHKIKAQKKEDWIQKDPERKIPKLNKKILLIPNQDQLFY